MKKFLISEEEKSRILGLHKEKGYNSTIVEQGPPTQKPANTQKPQTKISQNEIAASTDPTPIVSEKPLVDAGIPNVNKTNFKSFFGANGYENIKNSILGKSMSYFNSIQPRTTKFEDNVFAVYEDGTKKMLDGPGTIVLPTQGLTKLGGAGNGILALSRAILNNPNKGLPQKITITLGGNREASSYGYNSDIVNNTKTEFNTLVAWYIKPYVQQKGLKFDASYIHRDIYSDKQTTTPSIESLILGIIASSYIPKPIRENAPKYNVNLDVTDLVNLVKTTANGNMDDNTLNQKWTEIETKIKDRLKTELTNFITVKEPDKLNTYISKLNPSGADRTPSEEVKDLTTKRIPGYSIPTGSPQEKQSQTTFKSGQVK